MSIVDGVVQAAGGVVWRERDGAVEVLVVHRPRYDDWSFPKGKLDQDETHEQAALREVEEETGIRAELGAELRSATYRDARGRPKVVRYWAMGPVDGEGGLAVPNDEVDEARWVPAGEARRWLSYPHDVEVLESFTST